MRYRVVAVGPLKRGFFAEGCSHYLERLRAVRRVELIEVRAARGVEPEVGRRREGAALLKRAEGHLVALDERGQSWRSIDLARHLAGLELRGINLISLLIGGAEGHPSDLLKRADDRWSLSPLTLPHELARLVLLEQLYRAEAIRAGHPYHREG